MAATNSGKTRKIEKLFFVLYLLVLAYLLFFAEGMGRTISTGYRYNLEPFCEIKRFLYHVDILGWKTVFLNVAGNVIAFMPFGFFLPRITRRKVGLIFTVFSSGLFSLLVETIQLYSKAGSFDVDDLILNTFGGLCGYIVYFINHKIRTSRKG